MRDPAKSDAAAGGLRRTNGRARRAERCHARQRDLLARSVSMCRAAAARCEADNEVATYPHLGIFPHTQNVLGSLR